MQRRGLRFVILLILLSSGAFAGVYIWTSERLVQRLDEQRQLKEATVERLLSSIAAISTVQQAYADYGQHDIGSFTRVSLLVDRLTTDAAGLRAATQSGASSARLEEFWTALSALMGAESRARENLAIGDTAGAADALLASSREQVTTLNSSLRGFREAETENYRRLRTAATWRSWTAIGVAASFWLVGLVLFAVIPLRQPAPEVESSPTVVEPTETAVARPAIDLTATAAAATALSRLTDPASLSDWLGQVASILDARGVIVWMGAGDALYAAAAHGYDASLLDRIPPIPRSADNATAAAWRSGAVETVAADAGGFGAIVAPLQSPSGCIGVFAAEVGGGRESDETAGAVATILASQLASVLAAWPAASTTSLDASDLDRKAAAS